jgi:hypothetical protein
MADARKRLVFPPPDPAPPSVRALPRLKASNRNGLWTVIAACCKDYNKNIDKRQTNELPQHLND